MQRIDKPLDTGAAGPRSQWTFLLAAAGGTPGVHCANVGVYSSERLNRRVAVRVRLSVQ